MRVAYVDTSCLVAMAFGERGGTAVARRLAGFEELVAANLLQAELRSVFVREGLGAGLLGHSGPAVASGDRPGARGGICPRG